MSIQIIAVCACAGIIIGSVFVSGLGLKFTQSVIDMSGGNLLILLSLTAIAAIVLGMGMTTTAVYITVSALIVPSLEKLDVLPMAAHLFAFYFGVVSTITPPVALAAFAGAAIAKTPPMATAVESARVGGPTAAEGATARQSSLYGMLEGQQAVAAGEGPAEAGTEEGGAGARPRAGLRPGGLPYPHRLRPQLLRRAWHHPSGMEPGARAVQGLHRASETQHVPVAAHDAGRTRWNPGRSAGPHLLGRSHRGVGQRGGPP